MNKSNLIVLVSCGKHKLENKAAAADLYVSDRFKAARLFAQTHTKRWYILSAKHGLLKPSQVISPYDLDLESLTDGEKTVWAQDVANQLKQQGKKTDQFLILGRGAYSEYLSKYLENCICPLTDLTSDEELTLLDRLNRNDQRFKDFLKFYELLERLQKLPNQMLRFSELITKHVPVRGVYFFFDQQEPTRFGINGKLRIVRVGTHGVSAGSKSSLWQRLRAHKGTDSGAGSHRSSIFRLHIGKALLEIDQELLESWGIGETADNEIRTRETHLERRVSEYLANLRVAYIPILDKATADSDRSYIEKNVIALLTGGQALDLPSKHWLGNFSVSPAIYSSGLWNINYVGEEYVPEFLTIFEELVRRYEQGDITEQSLAPINWRRDMMRGNVGQQNLFG